MFKWPTNPKNPKITVKCLNCLTLAGQFFPGRRTLEGSRSRWNPTGSVKWNYDYYRIRKRQQTRIRFTSFLILLSVFFANNNSWRCLSSHEFATQLQMIILLNIWELSIRVGNLWCDLYYAFKSKRIFVKTCPCGWPSWW